ncbi:hypothetical protein Ddc_18101 [Ditylenchus destructor]|nr:hypothetical protein Ddc_18101 [Ditylenchus destructor]
MASLIIELSDFNNRLDEEFTADQLLKAEEGKTITSHQVLAYFKSYTKLTEKVGSVDRIFNLKATLDILNRHIPNWIEENRETTRVIKIFTNSIAQSNVGITVGGMTVITKSMILTCLSLVVPYTLLCLQLKIGSQNGGRKIGE